MNAPGCLERAEFLAKQLKLELVANDNKNYSFLLVVTPTHLELQRINSKDKPLKIDFLTGSLGYRLRAKQKNELLAKAIGIKPDKTLQVIDATAGLGRDGFLLATLGCKVIMLERSPIIAALLQDGLQRALAHADYAQLDIHLHCVDAYTYLQKLSLQEYPEVVYLDPMFPEKNNKALVKKEMQYLQALITQMEDSEKLLEIALKRAKHRVVVKRPYLAQPLAEKPSYAIIGKNIRFDVYEISF